MTQDLDQPAESPSPSSKANAEREPRGIRFWVMLNLLLLLGAVIVGGFALDRLRDLRGESHTLLSQPEASIANGEKGENNRRMDRVIPDDAVEFQGHHYRLFTERLNWKQANDRCASMGGHLAFVETLDESIFLSQLTDPVHRAWLGGRDDREEGAWKWTNGEPITVFDWTKENPSDLPNEDFLVMVGVASSKGRNGRWNDAQNSFHLIGGFICEWD